MFGAEDLGTGAIPDELSAILTARFRTLCKYGAALILKEALGPGDPLLPGTSCIGGRPHNRPEGGELGQVQPGRNGESLALTILYPV